MDLEVRGWDDEREVEDFGGEPVAYDSEFDGAGRTHTCCSRGIFREARLTLMKAIW